MLLQRKYERRDATSYSPTGSTPMSRVGAGRCSPPGSVVELHPEEEVGRDQHRLHGELDPALETLAVGQGHLRRSQETIELRGA